MEETPMSTTIEGKTILVTGANRGIGQALVTEALRRGAARVYAGTRQPYAHQAPRVTSLALDITNEGQVGAAAARVESLDILVNNTGIFLFDDLSDRAALETAPGGQPVRHLRHGPGLPAAPDRLRRRHRQQGVDRGPGPHPGDPAYSLSKAAACSLTQSLRMLLARQGVRVHAVLTGPTDTDVVRD